MAKLHPARIFTAIVLAFIALAASISASQSSATHRSAYLRELSKWREDHAAELQKPDGWLALAGLEWLDPGYNSFGSASDNAKHLPASAPPHIGVLHLEGDSVKLNAPAGGFPSGFLIDSKPVTEQVLRVDADHDKNDPRMTIGTLNFYVIKRGDRFALRIKDAKSAALTGFHGLKWYPPNPRYRVTAKWQPYTPAKTYTIERLVGAPYPAQIPGSAEFELDGKTYRLDPILEDPAVPKLFFVLRDTTSATTTYGACRFLYTALPSHGLDIPGELVLDFNKLENPPCAYTPFATCPLPPKQNRLPIALPVGERRYHD
jgi:uncharacterized protein